MTRASLVSNIVVYLGSLLFFLCAGCTILAVFVALAFDNGSATVTFIALGGAGIGVAALVIYLGKRFDDGRR